jgi:hypothetical protein
LRAEKYFFALRQNRARRDSKKWLGGRRAMPAHFVVLFPSCNYLRQRAVFPVFVRAAVLIFARGECACPLDRPFRDY